MNRVVIQEGYSLPFDAYRRKKRRKARRGGSQQNKMKTCAGKWRRSGKRGSYRAFMRKCLK